MLLVDKFLYTSLLLFTIGSVIAIVTPSDPYATPFFVQCIAVLSFIVGAIGLIVCTLVKIWA
mgnify:CR=1 FL=1